MDAIIFILAERISSPSHENFIIIFKRRSDAIWKRKKFIRLCGVNFTSTSFSVEIYIESSHLAFAIGISRRNHLVDNLIGIWNMASNEKVPCQLECTNLAKEWPKWKQKLLLFMRATSKMDGTASKTSTLLWYIGDCGVEIFNSLYARTAAAEIFNSKY